MDPRIEALEATARRLEREVAALRISISALQPDAGTVAEPPPAPAETPLPPETPPPSGDTKAKSWDELLGRLGVDAKTAARAVPPPRLPRVPTLPRFERRGLEELIGRYGTIALASLTILMGIGALTGWAIRNGYIGPPVQVALGLVAAIVVGGLGWRVRRGDSPRYGNALLALALAITHVVAWGAGPRLQLIPIPVVLALAGLSSAALAALAWRENDQTLFTIGFGGALLAPFVTSSGGGNAVLLLSYGFVVIMAGIASLGQREWTRAPLVASAGIVLYAAAGELLVDGASRWAVANAPAAFALGLAALAIVLLEGRKRADVVWPALLTALGVLVAVADSPANDDPQFGFALVLMAATMAAGDRTLRGMRTALLGALLIPLGASAVALGTLTDLTGLPAAGVVTLFAALSAWAAWKDLGGERGTWAFTATAQLGGALAVGSDERQLVFCLLISVFGVACALVTQRLRQPGIGIAGGLWMTAATVVAFVMLGDREAYVYRPFLTQASLAAGAVSLAWLLLSWHTARSLRPGSALAGDVPRSLIRMAGVVVAFFWVRTELAHAVSPDVSGFLLVAWYAVSGVASIFIGRARGLPPLRQAGLALSLFAALTAITEASLLSIGWRVGSYLLTGAFLLGVAWSYRVTRVPTADEGTAAPPP